MRWDMAKVIVERPRHGSRLKASRKKGYLRYLQRHGLEDLPRREPMLGRWRGMQRSLNEHLGPMRRFLRSRVGRPWNKVYQELCRHVALDNAVQNHVLTHVFDYVERRVEIQKGRIVAADGWRRGLPLRVGHLYVCPRSGLLKVVRPPKHRSPPKRLCAGAGNQLLSTEKWLWDVAERGAGVQYHRRDNVWWQVRVRKLPADPAERWDVWLERPVARLSVAQCREAYGGDVFATSKRPLTREEARELYRGIRLERR
jgi:hypothetical protein